MENYKEMYLNLFRAVTDTIEILKKAQQECEEIYISCNDQAFFPLFLPPQKEGSRTALVHPPQLYAKRKFKQTTSNF